MKLWERAVEARLRREVTTSDLQYGFMLRKNNSDVMLALRVLTEKVNISCSLLFWIKRKYTVGWPEKNCATAYRKSGLTKYEDSETVVSCTVRVRDCICVGMKKVTGLTVKQQ